MSPPTSTNGNGKVERPLAPEDLKAFIEKKAEKYAAEDPQVATQKQRGLLAGVLSTTLGGEDRSRHDAVTHWLTGYTSTKHMPDEYVRALLDWLSLENAEDGYIPGEEAIKEAGAVLTAALKAQGQKELPLPD